MTFGIIKNENEINYSDLEKMILDFLDIWSYNNIPIYKIIMNLSEYINKISKKRLKKYQAHYPNSVNQIINKILSMD